MKKIVIKDKYYEIEKIFEVLAELIFKSSDSFNQMEFRRFEKVNMMSQHIYTVILQKEFKQNYFVYLN